MSIVSCYDCYYRSYPFLEGAGERKNHNPQYNACARALASHRRPY